MKVTPEFIKAYDKIFDWVFKTQGLDRLIEFWRYLAPVMLEDLTELARNKGVEGCYDYWKKTLAEEKAKFDIELKDGKLTLKVHSCPAIQALGEPTCSEYCRHCGVMYAQVLEPLGLKYDWKKTGGGRCEIHVEKREAKNEIDRERRFSKTD